MSWVALGVGLGGAALSAGGQAYAAGQAPEGVARHSLPATGFMPQADPLLSALSNLGLAGIGQYDPNISRQAGPLQQLQAQALQSGMLNQRQFKLLQQASAADPSLLKGLEGLPAYTTDEKGRQVPTGGKERIDYLISKGIPKKDAIKIARGLPILQRQAGAQGYTGGLTELFGQADQARQQAAQQAEQFRPVAEAQQQAQLAQQMRLAGYIQNLPNLLTGEANPFIDELRNEALVSAQKYGYNPYAGLENARSQALQRALQLVSAEQAVGQQQQQPALAAAQLRQGGGATAAQLGAGQAQMLAQALASQQQAQAAQSQQWGQLGNTLGQFGLIGADMYMNRPTGPGTGQG